MTSKWAGAAFVLAAVLSTPGSASAGCWDGCCNNWGEYERACLCAGGIPLKNPARCEERGGGYTPPLPVDPRPRQLERYRVMIQGGLVDAARFASYPTSTDAEFLQAISQLHVSLSRTSMVSSAAGALYAAKADAEQAKYRDFYLPRFGMVDASDGLVPSLREELLSEKRRLAEVEEEQRRFWAVRERVVNGNESLLQASLLLQRTALTNKMRVAAHLGGLSHDEVESYTGVTTVSRRLPTPAPVAAEAWPWFLVGEPYVHPAFQNAVDAAESNLSSARMVALPSVGGDIETRLAFAETMAAGAEKAKRSEAAAYARYQEQVQANASAARHWSITRGANERLWETRRGLTFSAIPQAKSKLEWMQNSFRDDVWEFLTNGCQAAAWKTLRKTLLDPELKRISDEVFRGRNFVRTDDEIKAAWRLGTPLVAPTLTNYSRMTKVATISSMVKRLNGAFQERTLAAAEILSQADSGDPEELGRQLFSGFDSESRKEVRTALGQADLPLGFKKFWEAYFVGQP